MLARKDRVGADVFGWLKELERWKSEVEEEDRKKRKTKEGR